MKDYVLHIPRAVKFSIYHVSIIAILTLATGISLLNARHSRQPEEQTMPLIEKKAPPQLNSVSPAGYDVVFVSRKILKEGNINILSYSDMPGAGPHSHFRDCTPGKLQIYKANGTLVTLIDGSNPTAASMNLIDVNAPDVSYDGTQIVFCGMISTGYYIANDTLPDRRTGAWRIYKINVDGTGLTQLTNSSFVVDNTQFNTPGSTINNFSKYDDIDPTWLPDGRICFSSSRWSSFADYGCVITTNLYVMNNDGSSMHRITSERNGAERSMVDPLTGQIVFARWWRNGRFPLDDTTTIPNSTNDGYIQKGGLSSQPSVQSVMPYFINFNGWVASAINPDGTGLHLFAGGIGSNDQFDMYGGSFTTSGNLIGNYFPNNHMASEGGFGGVEKHVRGAGSYTSIAGYTSNGPTKAPAGTPDSLQRYYPVNGFATDATVLPNNKIILSWAPDTNQDYGLYITDSTGANKTLIYNNPGTSEMRAKAIYARTPAPIIPDQITQVASLYPPLAAGPYNTDGNFTFNCLNVYANGPVDMPITSAPSIGSAASIKFFINQQRTRFGSDSQQDWPILLTELPISSSGSVSNPNSPADVPLFEQLRTSSSKGYVVPTTGGQTPTSTAHVAGMNYGRPTQTMTCVGCHRGHSMIPVPANPSFTNLAPGLL